MKKPYTQAEVDAIRKDFERNPYWQIVKTDVKNRTFTTTAKPKGK